LQIIRDIIDILGLELGDYEWLGFFERASVASATAMVTTSTTTSTVMATAMSSPVSAAIAMLGHIQIDVNLSSFFNGCGKGHQTG
jgi:hypothetical protein